MPISDFYQINYDYHDVKIKTSVVCIYNTIAKRKEQIQQKNLFYRHTILTLQIKFVLFQILLFFLSKKPCALYIVQTDARKIQDFNVKTVMNQVFFLV